MCDEFFRADCRNIPRVQDTMIYEYIATKQIGVSDIREAKALRSSNDLYLDTTIGYVELKRIDNTCTVRAKIVPEDDKKKLINLTCVIDETNDVIINSTCQECSSVKDSCKHSLLFLMWLCKKSSEPSPEYESYWTKPIFSTLQKEFATIEEMFPKSKKIKLAPKDPTVLQNFLEECKKRNITNSLTIHYGLEANEN